MADNQEQIVITEVLDGNHEQYRFLVERYHRGLIQHLYNLTHDGDLAEDIAQEAFVRAYNKLAQYDESYAFSTWLYKIADNIAFGYMRQSKAAGNIADIEDILPDDKPSLAEVADREFTRQAVRDAVSTLPPEYQQVITLFYWDEKSYEDIAAITGRPIGTIRTWLHRAKNVLREELHGQI